MLLQTTPVRLAVPLGPAVRARRLRLRAGGEPLGHAAGEGRRGHRLCVTSNSVWFLFRGWLTGLEEVGRGDAQKQTRGAESGRFACGSEGALGTGGGGRGRV